MGEGILTSKHETLKNLHGTIPLEQASAFSILERILVPSSTFQVPSFHPPPHPQFPLPHDSRIHKSNRKRKSLSEGDGSGSVCTHAIRHRSRSTGWDRETETKGRIRGKEEKEKEIFPPLVEESEFENANSLQPSFRLFVRIREIQDFRVGVEKGRREREESFR